MRRLEGLGKTLSPIPFARTMGALQQSWSVVKNTGVGPHSPGGPTNDPAAESRQKDMDLNASLSNSHANQMFDDITPLLDELLSKLTPKILTPGMALEDSDAKKAHAKLRKVRDAIEDVLIHSHKRGSHTPGPGRPNHNGKGVGVRSASMGDDEDDSGTFF